MLLACTADVLEVMQTFDQLLAQRHEMLMSSIKASAC